MPGFIVSVPNSTCVHFYGTVFHFAKRFKGKLCLSLSQPPQTHFIFLGWWWNYSPSPPPYPDCVGFDINNVRSLWLDKQIIKKKPGWERGGSKNSDQIVRLDCWSNMNRESDTALPAAHLISLYKHIFVYCSVAVIQEPFWWFCVLLENKQKPSAAQLVQ